MTWYSDKQDVIKVLQKIGFVCASNADVCINIVKQNKIQGYKVVPERYGYLVHKYTQIYGKSIQMSYSHLRLLISFF